ILQEEDVRCLFFITGVSAGSTRAMLWYEELYLLLQCAPIGSIHIDVGDFPCGWLVDQNWRNCWWGLVRELSAPGTLAPFQILDVLHQKLESGSGRIAELHGNKSDVRRFFLLNGNELRALAEAGMTIGAHTMHHPLLSQCSDESAQAEILDSRRELQTAVQQE